MYYDCHGFIIDTCQVLSLFPPISFFLFYFLSSTLVYPWKHCNISDIMSLCAFYLAYLQSDIKNSQNSYHVPGLCIHNASCSMFFAEKVCPEGWRMFCHSCYVLSEKLGSWDEGRDDCRSKGADLVVIESLEDKTFISSYIKERAWIGLNDKEEEGNWKWVDGTPLTLHANGCSPLCDRLVSCPGCTLPLNLSLRGYAPCNPDKDRRMVVIVNLFNFYVNQTLDFVEHYVI
uniref:C-type lectin domain-containing protein n=1 Tax=Oreochromis aureus TaxID=47969 RepID=A0AAZ1XP24_OREAU